MVVDDSETFCLKDHFEELVKADLTMNVFKDGKWGFIAHQLLDHDGKNVHNFQE